MTRTKAEQVALRKLLMKPRPGQNLYPFDYSKPLRVLRDMLTLESVEALDLARSVGLEKRCETPTP